MRSCADSSDTVDEIRFLISPTLDNPPRPAKGHNNPFIWRLRQQLLNGLLCLRSTMKMRGRRRIH